MSAICVSQEFNRSVLGTSGFTESNGDFFIHATVGQSISNAFQSSYSDLRQGFQQPLSSNQTVYGCTNEQACNYNSNASEDDGSCDYISCFFGCMDLSGCNYNSNAIADDGSCDYSCCPGPGCCNNGTYWDEETQTCIVTYPSDSNFDLCVDLNDLMDLLSDYGMCLEPE